MSLVSRVIATIHRHALLRDGGRVLIALSGGADSMALLLLARELERDGVLSIAGAAHLNHQLRGAAADADEAFCAAVAARVGVPFRSDRADVAALARAQKRSLEDAARTARYTFLERVATEWSADVIAVAHTRDDQAETFLLRLLRGAGARGLSGIRPRAGRVVRPLLEIGRPELRAYLTEHGESYREDASNADVSIPRNRVRHELIPYLATHLSPGVTDVLAREAALAAQDEDFLHSQAIELAGRIVLKEDGSRLHLIPEAITLDAAGLAAAPLALGSRVAQASLERMAGSKAIGFEHVARLLALAAGRGAEGRALSLPGQYAVRTGSVVVLYAGRDLERASGPVPPKSSAVDGGPVSSKSGGDGPRRRSAAREGGNSFAFSLSIPGEVELSALGYAIGVEAISAARGPWVGRGSEVGVAAGAVELPLGVRNRRRGDRFRPLGAPGVRKLQDFLVDRKVARAERDALPLVVDGRDRIVWVVGQSVAEDFRVTDPSAGVLLLKVRRF